jgi:hypothetical protein
MLWNWFVKICPFSDPVSIPAMTEKTSRAAVGAVNVDTEFRTTYHPNACQQRCSCSGSFWKKKSSEFFLSLYFCFRSKWPSNIPLHAAACSRCISVSTVSIYLTGWTIQRNDRSIPHRDKRCCSSPKQPIARPTLSFTEPRIQTVLMAWGMHLATHLHRVSNLRVSVELALHFTITFMACKGKYLPSTFKVNIRRHEHCQLALFGYPDWGFSVLFPQL